ncbi:MAG: beta-ketoacyl synthase N-terminal-like domain-containing protein, partial [Myxococcota bacterium]|nr:beta-ketoacyl synthase N-terminal-like domain-containing protein [Myxococcota bacterium]
RAALDLGPALEACDPSRTSVYIGMQCDVQVARNGARWRASEWARAWAGALDVTLDDGWVAEARDGLDVLRGAAGVVGAMPNIPANRLCSQFDLRGPSFTLSAEELSGVVGLEIGARALRAGEIDAALVGAVDVCSDSVHQSAARDVLGPAQQTAGDAVVVLLLKRLSDAERAGDTVWAVLGGEGEARLALETGPEARGLTPQLGHSHAASGLLHVAAGAVACRYKASLPEVGSGDAARAQPWPPSDVLGGASVAIQALGGASETVHLSAPGPEAAPIVTEGPFEIASAGPACAGEVAFVFTGPAGSYRGMGAELLLAFPMLRERFLLHNPAVRASAGWIFEPEGPPPTPAQCLWGSSLLAQMHAAVTL